jgi:DNA repair protein RadA/Sms
MAGVPGGGGVSAPSLYKCRECDRMESRYFAQCGKCGKWNTLTPVDLAAQAGIYPAPSEGMANHRASLALPLPLQAPRAARPTPPPPPPRAIPVLSPVSLSAARLAQTPARRVATGIEELDRVLGGGLVDGSVILIGGEPGCGKSTLLLSALHALARTPDHDGALYVTGEESVQQIHLRAMRMGIENDRIAILATDDLDGALALAGRSAPTVVVIDSIQTARCAGSDQPAGSVQQVAACSAAIAKFAKGVGTPVIVVGQITKDGEIAGPKRLEHDVDVVLYLEAAGGARRELVAFKNRYGSTDEVGAFEMREAGLVCAPDSAGSAIAERAAGVPGSAVFPAVRGERVQLVEIQALVGPRKTDERPKGSIAVSGIDPKRVQMILAILAKHAAIDVGDRDVFVSVTAGARISDPAADLAIALAIASSYRDLPIDSSCVCFGELGLAGEIRSVGYAHARGSDSRRAGFGLTLAAQSDASEALGTGARTISDAIALVIGEAVAS